MNKFVPLKIPRETHAAIKVLAKKEKRTMSALVDLVIEERIEAKYNGKLPGAPAEATAGK